MELCVVESKQASRLAQSGQRMQVVTVPGQPRFGIRHDSILCSSMQYESRVVTESKIIGARVTGCLVWQWSIDGVAMSYSWAAPVLSTKKSPGIHVLATRTLGAGNPSPNAHACNTTFGLGVISIDKLITPNQCCLKINVELCNVHVSFGSHVVVFELQEWDSSYRS